MSIEEIIDTTRPSIARIYDHWLGGTHNFPVDRAAGKLMAETQPSVMQGLYLNRWFVSYTGKMLSQAEIMQFLDLGAGLPTEGALHEAVPETARVLYNDFDPDTIAYARYILQSERDDSPNVRFVQGRIEEIEPILDVAGSFLDVKQPIGICLIAVAHFIDDNSFRRTCRRLYEWAAPGSMLAISGSASNPSDPTQQAAIDAYEQRTGAKLYLRPAEELAQLLGPWQPVDDGFKPFEAYAEADLGTSVVRPDFRGRVGYAGFFSR